MFNKLEGGTFRLISTVIAGSGQSNYLPQKNCAWMHAKQLEWHGYKFFTIHYVPMMSLIQQSADRDKLGRVMSLNNMVSMGLSPVSTPWSPPYSLPTLAHVDYVDFWFNDGAGDDGADHPTESDSHCKLVTVWFE